MPDTKDIDETVCSDEQLLLIDLLYGELDADAEKTARDAIGADADLQGELDEFEALRGFMRELPDEEPPAALTAKLLHAAANAAPAEAKPAVAAADAAAASGGFFGWLKKLFEPMMLHPGLAAAASLVLVVGIAGALYLGGKSQVAQPTASTPAGVKAETTATPDSPAPPALMDPATGKQAAGQGARDSLDEDMPNTDTTTRPDENRRGEGDTKERKTAPVGAAGGLLETDKSGLKDTPKRRTKARPARTRAPGAKNQFEVGGGEAPQAPQVAKPRPKPAPTPRPTATPSPSADDGVPPQAPAKAKPKKPTSVRGSSGSTISAEPAPPPEPKPVDEEKSVQKKVSPAERLHQQARTAAKKGDCRRVVAIAAQVRKSDSRYYDTKFLGDSLIRRCLQSKQNVSK